MRRTHAPPSAPRYALAMYDRLERALEDAFGKSKTIGARLVWQVNEAGVGLEVALREKRGLGQATGRCDVEIAARDEPLRGAVHQIPIENPADVRNLIIALRRGDYGPPRPAPDAAAGV